MPYELSPIENVFSEGKNRRGAEKKTVLVYPGHSRQRVKQTTLKKNMISSVFDPGWLPALLPRLYGC
jgi:hypothetical protein